MTGNITTQQTVYATVTHGVSAWLVIDRIRNGLAFGGFRFSDSVDLDQVSLLASAMSWKLAAHGLPVGGAKAGICCRPDHPRIGAILKDLASAWRQPLLEHVVLGKDMGASDALLDQLYAELGRPQLHLVQRNSPSSPARIRDLCGYVRDMTGLGAVIAAEAAIGSLKGKRILIQGAGTVGTGVAIRAKQRGAIVAGMSDVDRAVVSANGLPVAELAVAARDQERPFCLALLETAGGTWMPRDQMLSEKADVLFLAAGSHVVTKTLAETIRSEVVIEASNFGLTPEANVALFARNILVVPDIISSSSSAAMTTHQLATGNGWQSGPLWDHIENNIRTAVTDGLLQASRSRVPLRDAYRAMYGAVLSH
ncbi:Glu/Leu/Phe/Val dehydrogenase [bacterium M00.F.Ca.ET.228.01.1.1]|nr:Glu/Leu/Phe/Val dehydrogenase [bacterium M00.F.Ca.ET.228.01.1.1]TGR95278.1 Glu/Leu/Phe/Val dehydrogenase [bacterium M00.F.Ca.ET.191.01.1.1]TGT96127.1 Glu/Leu/Phe/Val dehydrogenase [bacterium M00.F.Ca.ET.155.01.1.1]